MLRYSQMRLVHFAKIINERQGSAQAMAETPRSSVKDATSGFADLSPVPQSPFRFFSLPAELRRNTFLLYLGSLPATGQIKYCKCFKVVPGPPRDLAVPVDHPCYNLHAQFNCHAKFLPLF